ncbi:hypothetical protein Q0601_23770 [Paracoccus onubensis]|uniref:DUF6984 family protein n=1 Tax=Paracoccus onubensis TaxID=1675788 RepID=UPI00273215B4|nr:hypothetical protein [Paracoccus onubensis]MDP0930202.1 hypothetical protein [Paracoccus onubensis]
MRRINPEELAIIEVLLKAGEIDLSVNEQQNVWVVNPEMGSIRSEYCPKGCRVHPVFSGEFDDRDGIPVIATLLLTEDGKFGELDFWKVNDEPLLELPKSHVDFKFHPMKDG